MSGQDNWETNNVRFMVMKYGARERDFRGSDLAFSLQRQQQLEKRVSGGRIIRRRIQKMGKKLFPSNGERPSLPIRSLIV